MANTQSDFRPDASVVANPSQCQPMPVASLPTETMAILNNLLRGVCPINSPASLSTETFVTVDPATQKTLNTARAIRDRAPVQNAVLITGPSGCGKELLARLCARVGSPFVALNMAAHPDTLLASSLFGHVKGAFTGASDNYNGAFIAASDGTIFLDEIGDMPEAQQPTLLRVIERRVVTPVGSVAEIPLKCRIIAATNRPDDMRADLKARFMYHLTLHPLSMRMADLHAIGQHYGLTTDEIAAIPTGELMTENVRAIRRAAALKELGI